jgi:large subunit ribosomal protein L25
MQPTTLSTEIRDSRGKNAARQLRAKGRIPAVFYGNGTEPVAISLSPKELSAALSTEVRRNAVLELDVGGQKQLAMVKELQVHPVTRELRHADLYRVTLDSHIVVQVPLRANGKAKGVVAGAELFVLYRELPVRTTPDKIPTVIEVDVTNLDLNETLHVKDLPLPAGVTVALPAERSVISCHEARKKPDDEADAAAAAGAPGAPAAAGAAPAAGAVAAAPAAAAKPAAKK